MPETRLAGTAAWPIVLLWAIFVPTGIINTMLGPMLPLLSARWSLTDVQAGYLFAAQFLGSMCGVALSGKIGPQRGARPTLLLGLALMAIGSGTLLLVTRALGPVAVFAFGTGMGVTIPTVNLLVAALNPGRKSVALNHLNLFWGLGAVICPFLVALCHRCWQSIAPLLYGTVIWLCACGTAAIQIDLSVGAGRTETEADRNWSEVRWSNSLLPVLACLFFVYVATEAGVSGWIASHAMRTEWRGDLWTIVPAFFWGAMLLGRAVGHYLLQIVSEVQAVRFHLALALFGTAVLIGVPTAFGILVGAATAGLGLSTVFPYYIAMLSQGFGAQAAQAGSLLFAMAALGGAAGPFLVGLVSQHWSLRAGFAVPLAGCMALLALSGTLRGPLSSAPR